MNLRILGAGGHAKVSLEAYRSSGKEILAFHDDDPNLAGREILGIRVAGDIDAAIMSRDSLHVAIGDNRIRRGIADRLTDDRFPVVRHESAIVSPTAAIGAGTLVCAGVVIQASATVGRHVILNSQALVEHDVEIGDFSHIAPGVRLGGAVRIGVGALIGIGAVVLPGMSVGEAAVVGAGAVVVHDVPPGSTVVGNPARSR